MRPNRLSEQVFLELPPVLAHYLRGGRNVWLESLPQEGKLTFLNRSGVFVDLEAMAVERRQLIEMLGLSRARAFRYRVGFEQGRRDAARHFSVFDKNARLALQAAPVFAQLQGRYVAEPLRFEFDLEARKLYREIVLHSSVEALVHKMVTERARDCACWGAMGYVSGHISEILGRRVITLEQECLATGAPQCRLISRLESEWGEEADWAREALRPKSVDNELAELEERVSAAQKAARRTQLALNNLTRRLKSDLLMDHMIAQSPAMQPVISRARQVVSSDVPVLIVGETGSGRQTLATAMHFAGHRKGGPLEVLDTAGLSDGLLKQELLGFEKGAVGGLAKGHKGAALRAQSGTLFISELLDLDHESQGLVLKVLESGEVTPIGAAEAIKVDARVIVATRHEPLEKVDTGELREDLYYALAVARIDLPPLRERDMDILRLADEFLREFRERHDRPELSFSEDFKRAIVDCAWPGNVRQLRNVIEQAVLFAQSEHVAIADLPEDILMERWKRSPEDLSEEMIKAALRRANGNRSQAAELLGVGRTTLWRAMKRLQLD